MHPRHSCHPASWTAATGLAIAAFFLAALLMAAVQQYGDSLPAYPVGTQPLWDLGFALVPQITNPAWLPLPDVLIAATYALFLVTLVGWLPRPQLVGRRFCWAMAINFSLRALSVGATRYLLLPADKTPFVAPNPWLGALMVLFGGYRTASDMMFSGHTTGWVTMALFVGRYSRPPRVGGVRALFLGAAFWLVAAGGIVALIAVRGHYFADIVMAAIVARFTFNEYHLRLDSEFPRMFAPGILLRARASGKGEMPVKLVLPAVLQDSLGNRYTVDTHPSAALQVPPATAALELLHGAAGTSGTETEWVHTVSTHGRSNAARSRAHELAQWLDGE